MPWEVQEVETTHQAREDKAEQGVQVVGVRRAEETRSVELGPSEEAAERVEQTRCDDVLAEREVLVLRAMDFLDYLKL